MKALLSRRAGLILLLAPLGLFLLFFFLQPVAQFLLQGFINPDGSGTLAHVRRLAANHAYGQVLLQSIHISFWVTVWSIVIGYPVAYLLSVADRRKKSYWLLFVLLPFWSSFLVRTFAWVILLGKNGPLNGLLLWAGVSDSSQKLLHNEFAVVIGMTNVLTPFAILTMLGVMENIDKRLARAATTLGATREQAFFRVFLPLSIPGVAAAALLVFITGLGFFISPALLGSVGQTMIAQLIIQQVLELNDWHFAAILCLLLLVAGMVIFLLYDRLVGVSALAGQARSREGPSGAFSRNLGKALWKLPYWLGDVLAAATRHRRHGVGESNIVAIMVSALVVLFLIVPLLFLVPISFSGQPFINWPPTSFSMRWYQSLLSSPLWMSGAIRSLLVAFCTALLCFILAVPAALVFLRLGKTTATILFAVIISPLIVPRMVIAVALFYLYARMGIVGTDLGLTIGHTVIAMPYFFISVVAVLKTYDRNLDNAAATLGASPMATARRVTLPLIGTGLVSAALFAFVTSMDELNVALFASGGVTATLPKLMWDEATLNFSPMLAAVSTIMLLIMSIVVLVALRLNFQSKEH